MSESVDTNDAPCSENPLTPGIHDLEETESEPLLELEKCAAYSVESECTREGCDSGWISVEVIGQKPETIREYESVVHQLYESFYDNPRDISFLTFQKLVTASDTGQRQVLAEYLGNAVNLGCEDANSDTEKRSKEEVLNWILPDDIRQSFKR